MHWIYRQTYPFGELLYVQLIGSLVEGVCSPQSSLELGGGHDIITLIQRQSPGFLSSTEMWNIISYGQHGGRLLEPGGCFAVDWISLCGGRPLGKGWAYCEKWLSAAAQTPTQRCPSLRLWMIAVMSSLSIISPLVSETEKPELQCPLLESKNDIPAVS